MASEILKALEQMGRDMVRMGLVVGPGGNISARDAAKIYLSPTGYNLDSIAETEWSVIDLHGERQSAGLKPTSEAEMHIRIFRARPDIRFICHAHPTTTTGLISGGQTILPFTPDFVALVDRIEYLPFIVPCGRELAEAAARAAATGVNAIALANHGAITLGTTAREALTRMIVIEDQAKTQLAAIAAGKPKPLTAEEQDEIRHLDAEAYRKRLLSGTGK